MMLLKSISVICPHQTNTLRPKAWSLLWGLVLSLPLLVGCRKASPNLGTKEAPNPLVAKKVSGVSGVQVGRNAALLMQGASVDPAMINKVMGGFVYQAQASYASTRNKRTVKFSEKVKIQQQVGGHFHILMSNDQQKSAEVIWHNDKLYWRGKGRPYRITSDNVDSARQWQLKSYGRWRALVEIFGESIQLEDQGEEQVAGRACRKYSISLRSMTDTSLQKLPEGTAWAGRLPEHTRGKAANKQRQPSQASGSLCADLELGFPLKVKFRGAYRVGKNEATVAVSLNASFSRANTESVKPPAQIVTVSREPEPLDAFGKKKPTFFQEPPARRN